MELLNTKKTEEIKKVLQDKYGLSLDGTLLLSGSNKIRYFEGNLDNKMILYLLKNFLVESAGIYLGKIFDDGFRLSFDAANLLSNKIIKNVIEINREEMKEWFNGANLHTDKKDDFYAIKYGKDIIGCAKVSNKTIYNYVPKEKRFRKGIM